MRFILFILFCFICISPLQSIQIFEEKKYSKISIIHEDSIVNRDEGFIFGIKLDLNSGWKTYWKNPGDSGSQPRLMGYNKDKIKKINILFPTPSRFMESGIETIGYQGNIVFPVYVQLEKGVSILNEKLIFSYLICEKICIPIEEEIRLNVNLNISPKTSDKVLTESIESLPTKENINFSLNKITNNKNNNFDIHFKRKNNSTWNDLFLYTSEANFTYSINEKENDLVVTINVDTQKLKDDIKFEFLITSDNSAETKLISLKQSKAINNPFLVIMLIALIGGLILNLMPCVLPVLSLKIYSILDLSRGSHKEISLLCFSVVAGIFLSFLILATFTTVMRIVGYEIGWGIQFQSNTFIFLFALILLLFSLNLLGFFELILPSKITNFFNIRFKNKYLNSFFTGIVLTFLATPCSAPFLGTAVGYALSRGIIEIYTIFIFLAMGFSFPYLLPIIFKNSLKLIPKPGEWMNTFRIFLGFLVLISSLWFFSLLNINTKYLWLILMTIMVPMLFIIKKTKPTIFLISLFVLSFNAYFIKDIYSNPSNETWETFDEEKLSSLINNEKIVLVDVTADWCVTCQFNKITTLEKKSVLEYFKDKNVHLLRADWTNKDEKILNFMKVFGRYGIPLNIVYGPNKKDGIILSEILTPSQIIEKIELAY